MLVARHEVTGNFDIAKGEVAKDCRHPSHQFQSKTNGGSGKVRLKRPDALVNRALPARGGIIVWHNVNESLE
jgi:hypothetical protein